MHPRKLYARGAARLCAEFYDLDPKIDVQLTLQRLGFFVELCDINSKGFGFVDGDGEKVIFLNKHEPQCQQRWTVMHEVGHYLLGHHHEFKNYPAWWKRIEANAFAAELLMPERDFVKVCNMATTVCGVSAYFGVSLSPVFYRLDTLYWDGKIEIPYWASNPPEWVNVGYAKTLKEVV